MYILMLIIFLILITNIINICLMITILSKNDEEEKETSKVDISKRRSGNIAKVNFSNIMSGRNPYEYLQNNKGLYEPVKGTKGINLKTINKENEEL